MPLTRYQIRNEYGLADMELYGAADQDDPEALLEGVAMAGLVGVLRQLGDLADFAAEIFRCLHEELMVTAARGQGLVLRVQQLESGVPLIENAVLSQTDLSSCFSDPGSDWHLHLQIEKNLITHMELSPCIMDSYEECNGLPQLFLLDKFDVAGDGACLKRYSDPCLFKIQRAPSREAISEVGKEKKTQKLVKKGPHTRNGETPGLAPTSHTKLHQLFSMENVDSSYRDHVFHVKLKRRQLNESPLNSSSGRSYMEKFLGSPPECEKVPEIYSMSRVSILGNHDSCETVFEISAAKAAEKSCQAKETEVTVCNAQEVLPTPYMAYLNSRDTVKDIEIEPEPVTDDETVKMPSTPQKRMTIEKPLTDPEGGPTSGLNITFSGDLTTEVDNFTDAYASMESQPTETDDDHKLRNNVECLGVGKPQIYSDVDVNQEGVPSQFSDTQSLGDTSMLNVVHHSFGEESDVSYTDTPSTSAKSRPPNVEGSTETVDKDTAEAEMGTSKPVSLSGRDAKDSICKLKETPFCLSSCENHQHLPEDTATSTQFDSEILPVKELGMTLTETSSTFEVHSDSGDTIDASFEAHPVHQLPCVAPEAESSKNEVLRTDYADNCEIEDISNIEIESVISFSTLMEESFSCLTSQEMEVYPGRILESMKPEDIYSEADVSISAAEITSELVRPVEVESGNIFPTGHAGMTSFEDTSPVANLANKHAPEKDKDDLENGYSMDTTTGNKSYKISDEDGTITSDTPRNFQTGSMDLSASTHNDPLVDSGLVGMIPYHEHEDLQPVSIVSDDNQLEKLLAKDKDVKEDADMLKYHANISEDAYCSNRMGQDDIAVETMYGGELRNSDADMLCVHPDSICFPRQSLTDVERSILRHQKELEQASTLSSDCCSEIASEQNPYVLSVQDVFADLQDSSPAEPETGRSKQGHQISETESLPQYNHLEGSERTLRSVTTYLERYESKQSAAIDVEHPPGHKESPVSVNDCSEPMLSADHTDRGTCLDVSPEINLPISGFLQEAVQAKQDEMPPPPPLPPMQWWIRNPQPAACRALYESVKIIEASPNSINLTAAHGDSSVPMGEKTLQAASTACLPLPAIKHAALDQSEPSKDFEVEALQRVQQNSGEILDPHSAVPVLARALVDEKPQPSPRGSDGETEPSTVPPKDVLTSTRAGKTSPNNLVGPLANLGDNQHENPTIRKLPTPEVPIVDAVPAFDRSMLRKVSERVRPPAEAKIDEKDSLLELIRDKSFSLRPAVRLSRPNVQLGPQTNLKVAAILEKANTLRQAMAGSDDDDDSDSWSDT